MICKLSLVNTNVSYSWTLTDLLYKQFIEHVGAHSVSRHPPFHRVMRWNVEAHHGIVIPNTLRMEDEPIFLPVFCSGLTIIIIIMCYMV